MRERTDRVILQLSRCGESKNVEEACLNRISGGAV